MDEFFPFGVVIDNQRKIKPISAYNGDEYPTSQSVIKQLEQIIKNGIQNKEYLAGAIGIDIFITTNDDKKSAIEIREYPSHDNSISRVPYSKEKGRFLFQDDR